MQPRLDLVISLLSGSYLKATTGLGLIFHGDSGLGVDNNFKLEVYVHADYASKATDRRSVSGAAVLCGGAPVTWLSRTHKCVPRLRQNTLRWAMV